ncbi:hypothetical protein FO519_006067 [Halicephalobus sp. NKZ332]|nr:hypothetical protein FO519_006067 [Halicephalobus sp. NKZ332]
MEDFVIRYVHDPFPLICHAVVEIWDNFLQAIVIELNGNKLEIEKNKILNSICHNSMQKTTKFTVKVLKLYMERTNVEFLNQDDWRYHYNKLGVHELVAPITDMIVFHASKLVIEKQSIEMHFNEIRRTLLEGSPETRKSVQTKLLPRMLKSGVLNDIFIKARSSFFDSDDRFSSANPARSLEVRLLMTKFFVFDSNCPVSTWHDCVDIETMAEALLTVETDVKMLAWHLICQNPKLTRPFSYDELLLAKIFIFTNITEQQPGTRQRIATEFKGLMIRMRESYKLLTKNQNTQLLYELAASELFPEKTESVEESDDIGEVVLGNHIKFLKEVHDFLFDSLGPGSNFNRKLLSMYLIELLHDPGTVYNDGKQDIVYEKMGMKHWLTEDCYNLMSNLLDDGYAIIQNLAEKLIPKLQFKNKSEKVEELQLRFDVNSYKAKEYWIKLEKNERIKELEKMEKLVNDECRKIENDIRFLGEDITLTSLVTYLNGGIQSGVLVEEDRNILSSRILPLILKIGNLVSPIVHSLAPEGFWPEEVSKVPDSREAERRTKKGQQLLVNSWRTHKEVSTTLDSLISSVLTNDVVKLSRKLSVEKIEYIPPDGLKMITDYLWIQLTECRHCGAFEAAAVCFNTLCIVLWGLKDAENLPFDYSTIELPEKILDKLVNSLIGETEDGDSLEICETRRSAGLPPMVCGILTTEPKKNGNMVLGRCLKRLFNHNNQDQRMIIHTINCLVAIFENSELAEAVKQYMTPAFLLCLQKPLESENVKKAISFSDHWPIRNTIARFFSAIIKRMFGKASRPQKCLFIDPKCTKSSNEFFVQLPELYDIMNQNLKAFGNVDQNPRDEFQIYPLLTLLTHITPSNTGDFPLKIFHKKLAAVALIITSRKNEFLDFMEEVRKSGILKLLKLNNAIDGFLQLFIMITVKYEEEEIPEEICAVLKEIFKEILENFEFDGKNDIVLYHLLKSAVFFGSEDEKEKLVNNLLNLIGKKEIKNGLMIVGLAELISKNEFIWMKNSNKMTKELRFECYNLCEKIPEEIKKIVFDDFKEIENEDELEKILKAFSKNPNYLEYELLEKIEEFLGKKTRNDIRRKLMTCYINILGERNLEKNQIEMILEFFEYASCSFEAVTRMEALEAMVSLAMKQRNKNPEFFGILIKKILPSLQDESPEIREEMATVLGDVIIENNMNLVLNPMITWSFAVKEDPELMDELFYKTSLTKSRNGRSRVFALTELNPFAENKVIKDIDVIVEIVSRLNK